MSGRMWGYARVSSLDQNEARQIAALETFGLSRGDIFLDRKSGRNFDRPAYRRMLRLLKPGDTLAVKSIDRLGRNYGEIIAQWRLLTKEKGVNIVVLDMPLLDTRHETDITGTLISDIVLELLSYVAHMEREFIHSRQAEGIAAAKARGVRFGPRPKERGDAYRDSLALWREGKLSARAAGRRLGVSHTTFLKWAEEDGGDCK